MNRAETASSSHDGRGLLIGKAIPSVAVFAALVGATVVGTMAAEQLGAPTIAGGLAVIVAFVAGSRFALSIDDDRGQKMAPVFPMVLVSILVVTIAVGSELARRTGAEATASAIGVFLIVVGIAFAAFTFRGEHSE